MARRKLIDKLYKKSRENACKITKKEVLEDGSICFEFSGGFDMILPAETTDKEAIKKALKEW